LKVEFGMVRKERLDRPLGAEVCAIGQTSWGGVEESKCTTVEGEVTAGFRSLCAVHAAGGRGLDRHLVGAGPEMQEAIGQTSGGEVLLWCWWWEVAARLSCLFSFD
jgi:hypothetical protein